MSPNMISSRSRWCDDFLALKLEYGREEERASTKNEEVACGMLYIHN